MERLNSRSRGVSRRPVPLVCESQEDLCLIFDSRDEGSGQIQIVDQSQIRTVILFKSIQPGGRPLEFDFGANALYAPISEETLPANALEK